MSAVDLSDTEWAQVMAILSTAPWRDANPLLMKIGGQLQAHAGAKQTAEALERGIRLDGNGKEVRHGE